MEPEIKNIRINNLFWFNIGNGFISFGYKGIPEDTHFTISLSDKSDDYNIHLTRNIGADPKNKPKIEIVRIKKKILEKIGPYSLYNIICQFLRPIDLNGLTEDGFQFISIESLQTGPTAEEVESHLIKSFKPISKLKTKGRFRIEGSLENVFEDLVQNQEYLNAMANVCKDFRQVINTSTQGGMLIKGQKVVFVHRIDGQWFDFNPNVKPMKLLSTVVGRRWAVIIAQHTRVSLERIKDAKDYEQTKPWNNPIPLVANPEFEKWVDDRLSKSDPT